MNTPNHQVNTAEFWQDRYEHGYTGWDIGKISPPLQAYIDHLIAQGVDKTSQVLIAGAGNAYEAQYLHEQGFTNVIVLDFAQQPLANFAKANPTFPTSHLLQADFFALSPSDYQFDFIIEQTFFCAIDPDRRVEYAEQMARLLKPTGELFGVLFDRDFEQSPPFGGSLTEYQSLLSRYFTIVTLEPCYNSITPRQGSELFVRLRP
ncbi:MULTISPECIES: methyltransferase domain-containing protein [unclassified Moraxella]|uniref:methyltransferase domain-containing protein n=1 Tax=unclassified Moraxella TaxID=2685852 RepID=UPI003AF855A7